MFISNTSADSGYQIPRSLRFRVSASAYLSRTNAVATNRRTMTFCARVKRGKLGQSSPIFTTPSAGTPLYAISQLKFTATDTLQFLSTNAAGTALVQFDSTAVFRDASAWYDIVLYLDSTQATNVNGCRLYVNGQLVAGVYAAYTQNTDFYYTNAQAIWIGGPDPGSWYLDGYLSEVNFIDGQALPPSSFGEINPTTDQWVAKKYTGTYGTNGFYLPFDDITSTTTLGYDKSGNNNNWTPSGISLTAGATYDSMLDVPAGNAWVDGGNGRGNYAVLNPLYIGRSALSNANLTASGATDLPTIVPDSGSWYFEIGGVAKTWTPPAAFPVAAGDYNFGQRPFTNTPTAGHKTLHTGNLTSDTVTVSGSFTGNASADGPFVWCNGTPETLTINGNAVTFATHADRLANGFKLRTSSVSYNTAGTNTWTATILSPSLKSSFRNQNAKSNP